ncbi:sugar phosphate nucleotidyltransferase [Litoricolaceae bacterium]|nr:sugar phosphate nucleotidyltransferase [Litorivicinaceae bacterium]
MSQLNSDTLIGSDTSLFDVIKVIEQSPFRIAVVVSGDLTVLGSLTDGDVRRSLLNGSTMDAPAYLLMNKEPQVMVTNSQELSSLELNSLDNKYPRIEVLIAVDVKNRFLGLIDLRQCNARGQGMRNVGLDDVAVFCLVGGEGRRLRPLTLATPKPMLEFHGKPLLQWNIEKLRDLGFRKFFLSVSYLKDKIIDHFGDGASFGVEVVYVYEDVPLGTAGSLGLVDWSDFADVLVMNGDIITSFNFLDFFQFHKRRDYDCSIASRLYSVEIPFGVITSDGDSVESIEEKPRYSYHCCGGMYFFKTSILNNFPEGCLDMPDLINVIAKRASIGICPIYEDWIDIGTPADYAFAQKKMIEV